MEEFRSVNIDALLKMWLDTVPLAGLAEFPSAATFQFMDRWIPFCLVFVFRYGYKA